MKTYHDTETGILYIKSDPAETVEITSIELRQELIEFIDLLVRNAKEIDKDFVSVDKYLKKK